MKNGSSITQLAARLQSIRDTAKDIVVPPNHLEKVSAVVLDSLAPAGDSSSAISLADVAEATEAARKAAPAPVLGIQVKNGAVHQYAPSAWAHSQIADYAEIPKAYYDRVSRENPGLMVQAVNHGFAMSRGGSEGGRLLRTHGGVLRALVSSRYRTLDNFDLFEAIAPALIDLGFEPESVELTDRRMYLKVVSPKVQGEVKPGDVVQYGLVVSNSDVGAGSVRVEPLLFRLVCRNGAIGSTAIRKAHLGRNMAGDDIDDLLSDKTKELSDKAFWNQVRDVVVNTAKPEFFEREVNKLREAAGVALKNFDLPEVVERTARELKVSLGDGVKASILDNLAGGAHGAGLTKWGLSNAFTFGAQHESLSYDDATELERVGNRIVELSGKSWEAINAK